MPRAATLAVAIIALLMTGCGEGTEEQIEDADAIEAPERDAPRTAMPRADDPASTARFEAGGDGHVTGVARLYEPAMAVGPGADEPGTPEEGGAMGPAGFRIEVVLDGLESGEHAWHIHDGRCGESAGIAVAMTDLGDMAGISTPLTVRAEDAPARGAAMVRTLSLEDLEAGQYSLRVHASHGEGGPGPVVACADLPGDAATP
jgi:hypothetical protein